jgi:hypothetical protein
LNGTRSQANYAQAEASGDFAAKVQAAQSIAAIKAQADAFDQMANEHVASQQPPASAQRSEVDLTPDEVCRMLDVHPNTYNHGVARLQYLKSKGHYRE